jgi:hypothetical protein
MRIVDCVFAIDARFSVDDSSYEYKLRGDPRLGKIACGSYDALQ